MSDSLNGARKRHAPFGTLLEIAQNDLALGRLVDFVSHTKYWGQTAMFVVEDDAFDSILRRLRSQGVAYGSQPNDPTNGQIDHPLSERGLFFQMPDGHLFELMASNSGEA